MPSFLSRGRRAPFLNEVKKRLSAL